LISRLSFSARAAQGSYAIGTVAIILRDIEFQQRFGLRQLQ
jgi:hypothetical protein